MNQSFDEQISNEYFQQDLIQDHDGLEGLNDDSTYLEKNIPKTDARKQKHKLDIQSHKDDFNKKNNNMYPSFADMQTSQQQIAKNGKEEYDEEYNDQLQNPSIVHRSERSLS